MCEAEIAALLMGSRILPLSLVLRKEKRNWAMMMMGMMMMMGGGNVDDEIGDNDHLWLPSSI